MTLQKLTVPVANLLNLRRTALEDYVPEDVVFIVIAIACNLLIGLIADVVPESYQILGGKEREEKASLSKSVMSCRWMYHGKKPCFEMIFLLDKTCILLETWFLKCVFFLWPSRPFPQTCLTGGAKQVQAFEELPCPKVSLPGKLTCKPKMMVSKKNILFRAAPIFRFHASFLGCKHKFLLPNHNPA